mgnify:CR=1 FL=1
MQWLINAGHTITRIDDYEEWLEQIRNRADGLPERQRRHSVLPLLDAYRKPERPIRGATAPAEVFQSAVRAARLAPSKTFPCLGVADRQVRGRPAAPRPGLIEGCSRLPSMPVIAARRRLPTRLIVLSAAGLVVAGLSGCDATSSSGPSITPDADTRQVTVVGSGEVQGTPDTLNANVSIEFNAPDVTSAMNQTSDRQQAVINALVNSGVDRKDISTTSVSLQPQFGGGDNPTIIGYRASNSIAVKIRKLDAASQALALIVSTGGDATRINSVNYSIEDDSQLVEGRAQPGLRRRQGPRRAVRPAVRTDSGRRHFDLRVGRDDADPPPTPMPRAAMEAVPLEPGQQSVDFSVTVIWELT